MWGDLMSIELMNINIEIGKDNSAMEKVYHNFYK